MTLLCRPSFTPELSLAQFLAVVSADTPEIERDRVRFSVCTISKLTTAQKVGAKVHHHGDHQSHLEGKALSKRLIY